MNNNIKIAVAVLAIIIIGGLVAYNKTKPASPSENPTPITDNSIVGCYVATLSKDVYTLDIGSEKDGVVSGMLAFNNYQKDSSSGSFNGTLTNDILSGNYSFDSEGMHSDREVIFKKSGNNFIEGFGPVNVINGKEVFSDPSALTYDPKSTFTKSQDCMERFTDSNDTFSFKYNAFFQAMEGDTASSIDWRLNATQQGRVLARVIAPRTYMPGTNFSDARLTVGRSTDTSAITSCMTDTSNGEIKSGSRTISGHPFTMFTSSDAAAGNFYETTSYRGIVDGDCYVIEYTIHSGNIANYSPDQGIKEFDKSKIKAELEKTITSFEFIVSSS